MVRLRLKGKRIVEERGEGTRRKEKSACWGNCVIRFKSIQVCLFICLGFGWFGMEAFGRFGNEILILLFSNPWISSTVVVVIFHVVSWSRSLDGWLEGGRNGIDRCYREFV
jgi:hypothetical protein